MKELQKVTAVLCVNTYHLTSAPHGYDMQDRLDTIVLEYVSVIVYVFLQTSSCSYQSQRFMKSGHMDNS